MRLLLLLFVAVAFGCFGLGDRWLMLSWLVHMEWAGMEQLL